MRREIIRVEPLSTCLEKWQAPTSAIALFRGARRLPRQNRPCRTAAVIYCGPSLFEEVVQRATHGGLTCVPVR